MAADLGRLIQSKTSDTRLADARPLSKMPDARLADARPLSKMPDARLADARLMMRDYTHRWLCQLFTFV